MKFRRISRDNVEIGLAPLIDVVFILLLFFVVTTTFTRETQLQVDLPEQTEGDKAVRSESRVLEILIDRSGAFQLNGQALLHSDHDTLMAALKKEAAGDKELPVIISADGQAPHQSVVTAMDAAGDLGFVHLRITTLDSP